MEKIPELRAKLSDYAQSHDGYLYDDFNRGVKNIKENKGEEPYDADNVHLKEATFKEIARIFPFALIFARTANDRIIAELIHMQKIILRKTKMENRSITSEESTLLKHIELAKQEWRKIYIAPYQTINKQLSANALMSDYDRQSARILNTTNLGLSLSPTFQPLSSNNSASESQNLRIENSRTYSSQ